MPSAKSILVFFLSLFYIAGSSQVNAFMVEPIDTDSNYDANQNPHLVIEKESSTEDRLFLFLGGTESSPNSYSNFSNAIANCGFDVINLSYPNDLAAASLGNDSDSLVFNKYREEICFGSQVSNDVDVNALNSINTRLLKLLLYLTTNNPGHNWDDYLLDSETVDWSKVIISGHSQGSGHACYIGKSKLVERILMFSGPNDYSDFYSNSAAWIREEGVTVTERHFAYLSILDEVVDFEKQLTNLEGLEMYPAYDTTYVDPINSPYDNSHCLYTMQAPGFALLHHNSPIKLSTINISVWEYMLKTPIISNTTSVFIKNGILVFPNPTSSFLRVYSDDGINSAYYKVINTNGQLVLKGVIDSTEEFVVDISALSKGYYFLKIDSQVLKIIKE